MKDKMLFTITVPGSTANLGPGFDSIGLALNRYLTLEVKESSDWSFIPSSDNLTGIPTDKSNLIYEVAESVARDYNLSLPTCEVSLYSNIPLSRGMGSSAAAIVSGIELANQLLHLDLSVDEKARRASLIEGHPDNACASLYGGLVIGNHSDEDTNIVLGGCPDFDMVALIPETELKTKASRSILPESLAYKDAVKASSVSNVLVASIFQKRWDIMGKMMMKDLFHQPYRKSIVPELKTAFSIVGELNAYGVTLSGAGPIILFFTSKGNGKKLREQVQLKFPTYNVEELSVDQRGVVVEREVKQSYAT
ncbi:MULTISPECIES: homoserine kinase [Bacillaceae]|uniref:Homoserine kinase n=1 Tax=Evansella alkalicola TaxID=745819 RepID=A0ABS6JV52_9BACI|nr:MULTISPECIES: homoserine kinase [Bacillaceae]MBU9721020.1 homoserine kinase [Bacillus alkalicola]